MLPSAMINDSSNAICILFYLHFDTFVCNYNQILPVGALYTKTVVFILISVIIIIHTRLKRFPYFAALYSMLLLNELGYDYFSSKNIKCFI